MSEDADSPRRGSTAGEATKIDPTPSSYYAAYRATGDVPLLGGVERSRSCRYGERAQAQTYLDVALEVNRGAGRPCTGEVAGSAEPPQIFTHCPGQPAQAVGAHCPGCRRKLTPEDARTYVARRRWAARPDGSWLHAEMGLAVEAGGDGWWYVVRVDDCGEVLRDADALGWRQDPEGAMREAEELHARGLPRT